MKNKTDIVIDIEPISRRIIINQIETSILEVLLDFSIQIKSLCGGIGKCGKCKIIVQEGNKFLNPLSSAEKSLLTREEIQNGWRLACETKIATENKNKLKEINQPQFRIYLSENLLQEDFKILTSGKIKDTLLNPSIKKLFIDVEKPSLNKPIPDEERVLMALKLENDKDIFNFNFNVFKEISSILRESDHKITIVLRNGNEIINCEAGKTTDENFGIAIDIGTTTLVGYLINLNDGKTYSVASRLNPQTQFGEDIITRITYIKNNPDGLKKLNSILIEALNEIVVENCNKVNIKPSQIYEATIVGNSVMHHIFLGLNPISIGLSPYIPIIQHGLNVEAKKVDLNIFPEGNAYTLPIIAGFVGADTLGVILSSEIDKEEELTLIIDIGTNGEIVIGNKTSIAAGSCAAGSALEGAHIKDGMRAASGAIDSVKIDPENLDVSFTTINNKKPMGMCGSGLIDVVAEMLKAKIIAQNGNFNKKLIDNNRFVKKNSEIEFILVKKNQTMLNKDITISQNDIREIQMSKAAFYAGMKIILKNLNVVSQIKKINLAGAFGNYINKENAKFIGMIPDIPNENIFQIGNAAGIGAQICLLNKDFRIKAEKLLKVI
ncbi:MAG TPA: ASKHA domain-containing protein, partial [Candidatus Lokiarchaeia archaeon]